ncbi:strictosidine synthase family protein [Glycocaulis sp.]
MVRIILIAIGLVVLIALARVAYMIVPAAGWLSSHEPRLADRCQSLEVAPGTEDVTIHPEAGIAFVSAADRRTPNPPAGGIWTFDMADPDGTLTYASVDGPEDFQPHGISLYIGEDGVQRLFVINHPVAGGHTVEIFDIDDQWRLFHAETISYPELSSPNDLVAVGPRQFYATNDRGFVGGIMEPIEAYFGLPTSSVSYFDGETGRIAAGGLIYANGINISADGRTLYVAEFLGRAVNLYDRSPETGALTHRRRIGVRTGADNIEIDESGELWIGAHPRVFDFLAHMEDESVIAPSHVIRVNPETGQTVTVLYTDGEELSGSSVGAPWRYQFVVGAVFDSNVLICPRG